MVNFSGVTQKKQRERESRVSLYGNLKLDLFASWLCLFLELLLSFFLYGNFCDYSNVIKTNVRMYYLTNI